MDHFLIVKLSSIGDIVHALPAVSMIKRMRPAATISWVAERRSAEILRGSPIIDNLIEIDTRSLRSGDSRANLFSELAGQLRSVRQFDYDIAIDLQGLLKSAIVAMVSGAGRRWGFDKESLREPASRVFLTDTVSVPPNTHVIMKNMILSAAAAGVDARDEPLAFPIQTSESDKAKANEIADQERGPFAILNPAGGWVTKLWRAEDYGRLADLLWDAHKLRPIIAVGPAETELAEQVINGIRNAPATVVSPGLKTFFELARLAAVYVGGDTGPTHLAIAAGAPIVGIFGPTEWWRNGSLEPEDIVVERADIGCRVNCHRRSCDKWICMDIAPETVAEAVSERLRRAREAAAVPV